MGATSALGQLPAHRLRTGASGRGIYALAPNLMKRLLQQVNGMSESTLRSGAMVAAVAGFGFLFLLKCI
tara:strand:- start:534 stop:740 length:207 start_codon:yes stop_codon:yes gene_type:complete